LSSFNQSEVEIGVARWFGALHIVNGVRQKARAMETEGILANNKLRGDRHMTPESRLTGPRIAAILAIVLGTLAILVGALQGKAATVGPISMVVIVGALLSFRRRGR
jgi:hypothetical protein